MAKLLPHKKSQQIREIVFNRADEYGYMSRNRHENSQFMDSLVEDAKIGGVLREYMPKENVRTYIKDAILNAYTKRRKNMILASNTPVDTVKQVYGIETNEIHTEGGVTICQSADGRLFVVSQGTVLKWETALRKALEIIARRPGLSANGVKPFICLYLAIVNSTTTDGDRKHITDSLAAISVKVRFCGGDSVEN